MAFVDGQAGDEFSTLFELYRTIPLTDHCIFRTLAGLASTYCPRLSFAIIDPCFQPDIVIFLDYE